MPQLPIGHSTGFPDTLDCLLTYDREQLEMNEIFFLRIIELPVSAVSNPHVSLVYDADNDSIRPGFTSPNHPCDLPDLRRL